MGDADDSYDFSGSRICSQAARRYPLGWKPPRRHPARRHAGAHRYLGNPVMRSSAASFPRAGGGFPLRAARFSTAQPCSHWRAHPRMEFASEVIVKAALAVAHRRSARCCTPTAAAGRRTCAAGATVAAPALPADLQPALAVSLPRPGPAVRRRGLTAVLYFVTLRSAGGLDVHSMLYASAGALLGLQLCLFALFARVSARRRGLLAAPARPGEAALSATARARLAGGGSPRRPAASPGAPWPSGSGAKPARRPRSRIVMRDTIRQRVMVGGWKSCWLRSC